MVDPIATSATLQEDVDRAAHFQYLVDQGHAGSLAEAAVRFVAGNPQVACAIVGISSLEQLEAAVAAGNRGPLPADALASLAAVWEQS
jgi:aryl-alcohol dehydrogenase-like predicted oxidoreductase